MELEPELFLREPNQRLIITSFLKKIDAIQQGDSNLGSRLATITFDELYEFLQPEESNLVEILLKVNPMKFGFKGKHLGIVPVPNDLVKLDRQKIVLNGEEKVLAPSFVPRSVFLAFEKLNHSMTRDMNHSLVIDSGYRSPAFQIITLLHYLPIYDFDLAATAKRVAFPGYSEHGYPPTQAVDFMTHDGKPTDDEPLDFEETQEFAWLTNHANDFGFFLSYPKDNQDGIMYEPWHWRFEG